MKAMLFGIALLQMGCFFLLLGSLGFGTVSIVAGLAAGFLGICVTVFSLFLKGN